MKWKQSLNIKLILKPIFSLVLVLYENGESFEDGTDIGTTSQKGGIEVGSMNLASLVESGWYLMKEA